LSDIEVISFVLFLATSLCGPWYISYRYDIHWRSWKLAPYVMFFMGMAYFVWGGLFQLPMPMRHSGFVQDSSTMLIIGGTVAAIGGILILVFHFFTNIKR